jgi:hypothetical protein
MPQSKGWVKIIKNENTTGYGTYSLIVQHLTAGTGFTELQITVYIYVLYGEDGIIVYRVPGT